MLVPKAKRELHQVPLVPKVLLVLLDRKGTLVVPDLLVVLDPPDLRAKKVRKEAAVHLAQETA